jgi:hypothetical protein
MFGSAAGNPEAIQTLTGLAERLAVLLPTVNCQRSY